MGVREYLAVRRALPHVPARYRKALRWVEGSSVVLRRPRPDDEAGLASTMDLEVRRRNGWKPDHVVATRVAVRSHALVRAQVWALICERRTQRVAGSIRAEPVDTSCQAFELGWWLGPEWRGRGLGSEAVALALGALHGAGVPRVVFGTATDNHAVRRIAAKVGAVQHGVVEHELPNGDVIEGIWYVHDAC